MRGEALVRGPSGPAGERGSVLPLAAIALCAVVLALTLVVVGAEARLRLARAQWAADEAARAAAAEVIPGQPGGGAAARRAATRVAEANGAQLISIEIVPTVGRAAAAPSPIPISPTVVVEVSIGRVRAAAGAARFAVTGP